MNPGTYFKKGTAWRNWVHNDTERERIKHPESCATARAILRSLPTQYLAWIWGRFIWTVRQGETFPFTLHNAAAVSKGYLVLTSAPPKNGIGIWYNCWVATLSPVPWDHLIPPNPGITLCSLLLKNNTSRLHLTIPTPQTSVSALSVLPCTAMDAASMGWWTSFTTCLRLPRLAQWTCTSLL